MGSFSVALERALRRLSRAPLFTAVSLLTLALGIGANAALFSVIYGVLLRPLPFPEPERLVGVWHTAPGLGFKQLNASPSTYYTYKEDGRTFQDSAIYNQSSVSVTGIAEPEQVRVLYGTQSLIPLLGVQPAIGRSFLPAEDQPSGPDAVVLMHAYFQRRFGGDPAAVGRKLLIDGKPHDIIGVMPPGFRFLDTNPMLLLPLRLDRSKVFVGNFSYRGVARLKPGVTIEQANADVARMLPTMVNKFALPPGFSLKMIQDVKLGPDIHPLQQDAVGEVGNVLWVLMGTVMIVLLIACANVANLFLVRSEGRQQELAIRAALGAGWGRLAAELLSESVILGMAGGAVGLGLAYGGIRLLQALEPSNLPRLAEIAIDWPVIGFTLLVSLLAGLAFGLIPVVKYAGVQLGSALKGGGRNASDSRERHRVRGALVVVQVALALVLLICSGLMMRTFAELRKVQPGFVEPQNVLTLRLSIPETLMKDDEQALRTHEQILNRIRHVPGVESAALTSSVTMDGYDSNDPVFVEQFPMKEGQMPPIRRYKWISPGFFATMGNPLIAGRDLTWDDIFRLRPVVVISRDLAREFWQDPQQAIGKRIRERPNGTWREIVGVSGSERDDGVHQKATPVVYWPLRLADFWDQKTFTRRSSVYVIRSPRAGTEPFASEIRAAVWSVNNSLPLASVRTLERIYERSMAQTSFAMVMLGIAAAMALLLGLVGIYGVIAYAVAQRTREIGIRMALGAEQWQVRRMFVREGLLLTGIGAAAGLAAAAGLTRLMGSLLFGVTPLDPITYAGVSLALIAAAMLASYLPARRATSVDPVQALHVE